MKIKHMFMGIIMTLMLMVGGFENAYASELEEEWYDLSIIDVEDDEREVSENLSPRTRYIMDVVSALKKTGSTTAAMRSDVYCSSEMSRVKVCIQLQKIKNNSWVVVGQAESTSYNKSHVAKEAHVQNLRPGVYRCKSTALAVDEFGYSETLSSASGGVTFP